MVGYKNERQTIEIGRDRFTGGDAGGGLHPLALARWGAGGRAIFMIQQKNIIDIMKYTL